MGMPDVAVKNWLSKKSRFADFFNGIIFNGKQVILPHELTEMKSEADFIVTDKSKYKKDKSVQRYRDITMSWKSDIVLMILACEVQDKVHYAMPVRNMLYDSLSYIEQMKIIWNELSDEDKKNVTNDEFFSRFRKEDKLHPVITLVFYYGTNEWDGNNDIYDMFDIPHDEYIGTLLRYVSNYRINLIEPMKFTDAEASSFKTDLQMIMGMLRYRQDKEKMIEYVNRHKKFFGSVDRETTHAIGAVLHSKKLVTIIENAKTDEKKEGDDVCKALDDLYNDGVAKGEIIGITKGEIIGITKGEIIGIAKGEIKGESKGDLKRCRKTILDFLSEYGEVNDELTKMVNSESNITKLEKWIKLSARVSSIQEFENLIN